MDWQQLRIEKSRSVPGFKLCLAWQNAIALPLMPSPLPVHSKIQTWPAQTECHWSTSCATTSATTSQNSRLPHSDRIPVLYHLCHHHGHLNDSFIRSLQTDYKEWDFRWLRKWTMVGAFSAAESATRNLVYLFVVLRPFNVLHEQVWLSDTKKSLYKKTRVWLTSVNK